MTILDFISGSRWYEFDGWCLARSIDPLKLRFPRFLNLAHHYMLEIVRHPYEKDIVTRCNTISDALTGALTTHRKAVTVNGKTMKAPSWWISDEEASRTSLATVQQLNRASGR